MRLILACIKELQLITFPKKYHFKASIFSKKKQKIMTVICLSLLLFDCVLLIVLKDQSIE